jgi:hypothetical protein
VLRRMFESKRNERGGGCRKPHNWELNYLRYSPNIIRMIKSRRMRWVRHIARMGEKPIAYRIFVEKPEEEVY